MIEYSGPTHDPAFLYPAVDKAERDAVLKANASWLAPNHYVPNMDRLIVTIQLWVVKAGGNMIVIDTGVGNRKPRASAARMDRLNTLVMPWLESIDAGPDQVTHVVQTHMHTDHVGWNTVEKDGKWVPTFPKARYLFPKDEFDYWQGDIRQGRQGREPGLVRRQRAADRRSGARGLHGRQERGCGLSRARAGAWPRTRDAVVSYPVARRRGHFHRGRDAQRDPDRAAGLERPLCLWPDKALESRAAVLKRAAERSALIMPMHLGAPYCGYVRRQGEGYAFEPAT